MRRGIPAVVILVLGLMLVFGAGLYAQIGKDTKTGLDRIDGTIQVLDKAKSTMDLKQRGTTTGAMWHVAYNDKTTISMRNKPAKIEDLKEGVRVIVLGKYEKDVLNASRIDIRTAK
jgi:hypothetical protein